MVLDASIWQAASVNAVIALQCSCLLVSLAHVGPCTAIRLRLCSVRYLGYAYFSILGWIRSRVWKLTSWSFPYLGLWFTRWFSLRVHKQDSSWVKLNCDLGPNMLQQLMDM